MGKSRLFVFQLKEIIYTAIFVILAIILIIVLIAMFKPGSSKKANVSYVPGVYSTQLSLSDTYLNIEVTVDETTIKSIDITNLTETIATLYPLLEPSVDSIEAQLLEGTPIESVEITDGSKYTQTLIVQSITDCLNKAKE